MVAVVAVFSLAACAQKNKDVPEKVKISFNQKFPDATRIKWDKENAKEWEAEFKMNGKEYSANFSTSGTWKETGYKIEKSEIPADVKNTLDTEFNGYKIEEAYVSKTVEGKVYEIQLRFGETNIEVVITPDGKIARKQDNEEGDEENDND